MNVTIIGGGPGGLYFAILLKRQDPTSVITLYERNGPDDTFGWGVVLGGRIHAFLEERDPESAASLRAEMQYWDDVIVVHRGESVAIGGNQFAGIARIALLHRLHARCRELGVTLHFNADITDPAQLPPADLVVGADGVNSLVRRVYEPYFQPSIDTRQNRFTWLGTHQRFNGLAMIFRENADGLFIGHAYTFAPDASTFVVECPPETWLKARLHERDEADALAYLAEVFCDDLGGAALMSNGPLRWRNFPLIKNKHWYHENVVLLGDALHTAHFSIGSGTRLAFEDAMALADSCAKHTRVADILADFERTRKPRVDEIQEAALTSLQWLEEVHTHLWLDPVPFAYRLLTRSRRVGYQRIKRKAPEFIARYDAWRETQAREGAIPRDFLDLFTKRAHGHLATLLADGSPHVTPVWVDYDGEYLLINSARGRQKDISMSKRPRVSLEIADPDNPNRYLTVLGTVVEITEEGADAHLDRLAQRYLGREAYPPTWRFAGEVRRLYKIRPDKVIAWEPFG